METPRPMQTSFLGPQYIKQVEGLYTPPQPYTSMGFPHMGRDLRSPNYRQLPVDFVQTKPLNPEFLPIHLDFNRYIYNKKTGYVDRGMTYPVYTTGFYTGYS